MRRGAGSTATLKKKPAAGAKSRVAKKKPGDDADAAAAVPASAVMETSAAARTAVESTASMSMATRVLVKPKTQLQLTDEELGQEYTKILTANNPEAPANIVLYNHKERQYKLLPSVDQIAFHFAQDGPYIHRESDEAKRQLALEAEKGGSDSNGEEGGSKGLRNQFNFSERACQTFNPARRERGTLTEPPPRVEFSAVASQSEIYDAYVEHAAQIKYTKERKAGGGVASQSSLDARKQSASKDGGSGAVSSGAGKHEEDVIHSSNFSRSARIMERMVNQNSFEDVAQDFKYWEDEADQYRDGEGSLLPLWRFSTEKPKRKTITALCWNPEYKDMFAVGYGSYDFLRPTTGAICIFSLKNPSHPEYMFTMESGVMCLDFHPQHSSLMAVGLYDGTVMVFDVQQKVNKPLFQSTVKTGKHTDPVRQVRWQEEDLAKNLNFFSISSDGRVTLWTMIKNELQHTDVVELKLTSQAKEGDGDEDTALFGLAGGCSFDFNRTSEHLFIVGTEEGKVHKCSKAYSSQYLETYDAHHMAVYTVAWNPYHPRAFLTASADWTVKLWDHNLRQPVLSFDLNDSVADVAWAPYSGTVFAALTASGRVFVFDLAENKFEPLCDQQVVKKAKLTHIAFSHNDPIILVADDKGTVNCLKLSPNLRKCAAPIDGKTKMDVEAERLDRMLSHHDATGQTPGQ